VKIFAKVSFLANHIQNVLSAKNPAQIVKKTFLTERTRLEYIPLLCRKLKMFDRPRKNVLATGDRRQLDHLCNTKVFVKMF